MKVIISYSKRRSVSLKVKNGDLLISAPIGTSKNDINKILEKHSEWIKKAVAREKATREKFESLSESDVKMLKKEARKYLVPLCEYYSSLTGLEYNKISITSAKTRFGSCSSAKNISFSYRIMLYPESAREYVVLHEIAHLKEMNHSPDFYAIIERYMPDYKVRRKLLKSK